MVAEHTAASLASGARWVADHRHIRDLVRTP